VWGHKQVGVLFKLLREELERLLVRKVEQPHLPVRTLSIDVS
jgi:hypothetical protein